MFDMFGDYDFTADFGGEWNIFAGTNDEFLQQDLNFMGDVGGGAVDELDFDGDTTGGATADDLNEYLDETDIYGATNDGDYGIISSKTKPTKKAEPKSAWDKFSNSRLAPAAVNMAGGIIGSYVQQKAARQAEEDQRKRYAEGFRSGAGLSIWSARKRSS